MLSTALLQALAASVNPVPASPDAGWLVGTAGGRAAYSALRSTLLFLAWRAGTRTSKHFGEDTLFLPCLFHLQIFLLYFWIRHQMGQ